MPLLYVLNTKSGDERFEEYITITAAIETRLATWNTQDMFAKSPWFARLSLFFNVHSRSTAHERATCIDVDVFYLPVDIKVRHADKI